MNSGVRRTRICMRGWPSGARWGGRAVRAASLGNEPLGDDRGAGGGSAPWGSAGGSCCPEPGPLRFARSPGWLPATASASPLRHAPVTASGPGLEAGNAGCSGRRRAPVSTATAIAFSSALSSTSSCERKNRLVRLAKKPANAGERGRQGPVRGQGRPGGALGHCRCALAVLLLDTAILLSLMTPPAAGDAREAAARCPCPPASPAGRARRTQARAAPSSPLWPTEAPTSAAGRGSPSATASIALWRCGDLTLLRILQHSPSLSMKGAIAFLAAFAVANADFVRVALNKRDNKDLFYSQAFTSSQAVVDSACALPGPARAHGGPAAPPRGPARPCAPGPHLRGPTGRCAQALARSSSTVRPAPARSLPVLRLTAALRAPPPRPPRVHVAG